MTQARVDFRVGNEWLGHTQDGPFKVANKGFKTPDFMGTIITTTTNDSLVAGHISTITGKTGSAYWDMERGGFRSFRWENIIAVL